MILYTVCAGKYLKNMINLFYILLVWVVDEVHDVCFYFFAVNVHLQVREMVEIITREFIQMGGSAGEVRIMTK